MFRAVHFDGYGGLLILCLLAACCLTACATNDDDDDDFEAVDDDDDGTPAETIYDEPRSGWSVVRVNDTVEIRRDNRVLYTLVGAETLRFTPRSSMTFGVFHLWAEDEVARKLTFDVRDGKLRLMDGGEIVGQVLVSLAGGGNLRLETLITEPRQSQGIRLRFALWPGDRFWGFGEQYNFIDLRGHVVPIWVQEQGLGRSASPVLPFQGSLTNTYFPMPWTFDPRKGKGLLLENTEYGVFDLGATDARSWSLDVWNGRRASMVVMPGPKPADLVRQLTDTVGRPETSPPDWAFDGAWIAAQGGTDAVRDRVENALEAGVPISAVWVQDWVGLRDFGLENFGVKYRWVHDEELYPHLDDLIADLAAQGIRFLGYFNPFVVPDYDHWADGVENGYVVRDDAGLPIVFLISTFFGGLLDVTNDDAIAWFQGYARDALELGMKGWMADFGEWLPFFSRLANGQSSAEHNLYPTRWHAANRDLLEAAHDDDFVLLTRSGFTGEQRVAQVVWAGDQETDWSETDGLPTVIAAGLSLGFAGIPYFTHDIGGFSGGPREKELMLRWIELGAFTPVMRTHDGLKKLDNHHFDSDAETLTHFARFAKIHAALGSYWKTLADEATESGLPMVRHTALVDPEWDAAYDAHHQWMLGDDLLIAPVVAKGALSVTASLPDGEWEHLFTGETFDGRQIVSVDAPIGEPAVFVRNGRLTAEVEAIRGL